MQEKDLIEIKVLSSLDQTEQPSLFYQASGAEKRPLLVGLHTWSFDRFNQIENMLPYAKENNFHLLLPEFRGPNKKDNPEYQKACGSEYAVQDVFDAIEYAKTHFAVDEENIFLLGASGGGQVALLCGGKNPKLFKAIGAFVPVCDLQRWARENTWYAQLVNACCNGSEEEMQKRSPVSYVQELTKANLKIFHGKFDPVVSVKQSLDLYAEIMRIDPASRVFLDIFDGGHEINMKVAFAWLLSQYKKERLTAVTG